MSSQRFPSGDAGRAGRFPTDGAIGSLRAHDQAAIDHFLRFAEQERRRLEAKVIEAEMRYREAHAQLAEATHENQQVAEQLYLMWQELQAEREHTSRVVSARLDEVRAEAEELAQWTDPLAGGSEPAYGVTHEAGPPASAPEWVAPAPADSPGPRADYSAAEAAFFDTEFDDEVGWAKLDDEPAHVHEDLLARHPRRSGARPPTPPSSAPPPTPPSSAPPPTSGPPLFAAGDEGGFWQLEQTSAALRIHQLEDTFRSLLPMLALVAVLVVILAWIG